MHTPHIDNLAASGLMFNRAYTQYSYCAPSVRPSLPCPSLGAPVAASCRTRHGGHGGCAVCVFLAAYEATCMLSSLRHKSTPPSRTLYCCSTATFAFYLTPSSQTRFPSTHIFFHPPTSGIRHSPSFPLSAWSGSATRSCQYKHDQFWQSSGQVDAPQCHAFLTHFHHSCSGRDVAQIAPRTTISSTISERTTLVRTGSPCQNILKPTTTWCLALARWVLRC